MRPKLLDLFCGAGGAAMGYHRAGFEVVGVDIKPQKNYPFRFVQADAMTLPFKMMGRWFDAIHASPPCQDHIRGPVSKHGTGWMLAAIREQLKASYLPWVIENVPGAPINPNYRLCGCMFGLKRLKRERWFETSWHDFALRLSCNHSERPITIIGRGTPTDCWKVYGSVSLTDARRVMGIDWMTRIELSQAIPPAYTEFIGKQLIEHVKNNSVQCSR